jgi:hypothetical protein
VPCFLLERDDELAEPQENHADVRDLVLESTNAAVECNVRVVGKSGRRFLLTVLGLWRTDEPPHGDDRLRRGVFRRADERTRTADISSSQVIIVVGHGAAEGYKMPANQH